MLVLGVITLFLTGFVLIEYAYLHRHTDHDVSFFLSVGIIAMVMNFCTNGSESAVVLSVLYLVIDALFIGASFLVDAQETIGFYKSIGPWAKATFTAPTVALDLVSFIIAPAGLVLYFVNHSKNAVSAERCGVRGIWGILVWLLLLWMIFGIL